MRLIILSALILLNLTSNAQEFKSFNDLFNSKKNPVVPKVYVAKDGFVYREGDTLLLNIPICGGDNFFFVEGNNLIGEYVKLNHEYCKTKFVIKSFQVVGNKKMGFRLKVKSKANGQGVNYSFDLENALQYNEVVRIK